MSRRDLKPTLMPDHLLIEAVNMYKYAKDEEKHYKDIASSNGAKIKEELRNRNVSEFVTGDIRVTISISEKSDVNELQSIEILRKALTPEQFSRVVKTREYIDDDEFEKMVYAKEVDAEILAPAITPLPPTVTLRLGKAKKK